MDDVVLDASAVLAVILGEPGAERVVPNLPTGRLSVINYAEVLTKLIERGDDPVVAIARSSLGYELVVFDPAAATRTAALWTLTRVRGLSLGDRACLALAEREGLPVLTADRAWADLDIEVEVRLIR